MSHRGFQQRDRNSAASRFSLMRGQSMLEHALLIVAVVSALVLMTEYVRRSLNGFSRLGHSGM